MMNAAVHFEIVYMFIKKNQIDNSVTPLSAIDKTKFWMVSDMSFERSQRAMMNAIVRFEIAYMVVKSVHVNRQFSFFVT